MNLQPVSSAIPMMPNTSFYFAHDDDANSDTGSTASGSGGMTISNTTSSTSNTVPIPPSIATPTTTTTPTNPQPPPPSTTTTTTSPISEISLIFQQQQQLLQQQQLSQSTEDGTSEPPQKRKKGNARKTSIGDKAGKGLRHFSLKVCEKVQRKKQTTYNEVADELVQEFMGTSAQPGTSSGGDEQVHDQKNIRRRVYDALNVLMAMNIISKDKKEIKWKGLPLNFQQEYENLNSQKRKLDDSIAKKKIALLEVEQQRQALKNLCERNMQSAYASLDESSRIGLPFIIVNTNRHTMIECEMNAEGTEIFFEFSAPFELHDDNEILKRMGMHEPQPPLLQSSGSTEGSSSSPSGSSTEIIASTSSPQSLSSHLPTDIDHHSNSR